MQLAVQKGVNQAKDFRENIFNLTWITNTDRRNTDDTQMREATPQQA